MSRRPKTCRTGKVGYRSRLDAEVRAQRASEWHRVRMRVYRCPECRMWHTSRIKK